MGGEAEGERTDPFQPHARPQGWESTPTDALPGHIPGPRTEGRRLAEEGHPLEPTLGPMSKEEMGHNREAVAMGEEEQVSQ